MVTPAGRTPSSIHQPGELSGRVQAELRAEQARQGLTNIALGELTGDSYKVIGRIVGTNWPGSDGPGDVTLAELDRVCRALRVGVAELITRAAGRPEQKRRAS